MGAVFIYIGKKLSNSQWGLNDAILEAMKLHRNAWAYAAQHNISFGNASVRWVMSEMREERRKVISQWDCMSDEVILGLMKLHLKHGHMQYQIRLQLISIQHFTTIFHLRYVRVCVSEMVLMNF